MKNKTEKILEQLFTLARDKEPVSNARVVAALYFKGKPLAYGFNQSRTSWVQRRFKKNPDACFLHAETDAVRNALKISDKDTIAKSTLYISRAKSVGGKWVFGNAKPCIGCQSCIDWFGIGRVIYSTECGYEPLAKEVK